MKWPGRKGGAFLAVALLAALVPAPSFGQSDFDWRNVGGVNFMTPVKNQGSVNTCWAFAALAAAEAKYKITRNDPTFDIDLSEQFLVCDGRAGNATLGGYDTTALTVIQSTGVCTEAELPYTALNSSPNWPLAAGWQDRVVQIASTNVGIHLGIADLKSNLKSCGPMTVEITVDNDFYPPVNNNRGLHVVVITGWHDATAQDDATVQAAGGYFLAKNSWGSTWSAVSGTPGDGYAKLLYTTVTTSKVLSEIAGAAWFTGALGSGAWQGGSGVWSTSAAQWIKSGSNLGWTNGEDAAVFSSPGGAISVDSKISAHALTLAPGATGYGFSGGSLIVTGGGIQAGESGVFNTPITVGASQQWTVAAGKTLTINGGIDTHISTLTIANDGDVVVSSTISDVSTDSSFSTLGLLAGASGSLAKSGSGTLTLTGANGAVTVPGGLVIGGGRVVLDNTLANNNHRLPDTADVAVPGGGELVLIGNAAGTAQNVQNVNLGPGTATLTVVANGNVAALNGASLVRQGAAVGLVRGTGLGSGAGGATGQVLLAAPPVLSNTGSGDEIGIVPYLIGDASPAGSGSDLVTYGSNGLRPLDSGEYNSALVANKNVKLAASAATDDLSLRSLVLTNSGAGTALTIHPGKMVTLTSNAILSTGTVPNAISGGSLTFGNNDATGNEGIVFTPADLTLGSALVDNGTNAVSVTKAGGGALTLAATCVYTGPTQVIAGTLRLGTNNALPSGSGAGTVTLAGGATLDLAGHNQALNALAGNGSIDNSQPAPSVLTLANNGPPAACLGAIKSTAGPVSLVKTGSGALALLGANTYSGATIIGQGTLRLGTNDGFQAYAADTGEANQRALQSLGYQFQVNAPITISQLGVFDSGGDGLASSHDVRLLNSQQQLLVAMSFSAGTVATLSNGYRFQSLGMPLSLGPGGYTLIASNMGNNDRYYNGPSAGPTYGGPNNEISFVGTSLSGPTPWNPTSQDDYVYQYSAASFIFGTGTAGALSSIPATSPVSIAAGAAFDLSGNTETIGPLSGQGNVTLGKGALTVNSMTDSLFAGSVSGGGSLVKAGSGSLTFSGTHSYSGTTTVSSGRFVVNGSIASSSGVSVAAGAVLAGAGVVGPISGGGTVSPGNSPGILTAKNLDPRNGLGFTFELMQPGSPDYTNPAASINDVLRLTDTSSPFYSALGPGNEVTVLLGLSTIHPGDCFRGAWYTDKNNSFLDLIGGATFDYYVAGDGRGTHPFNGEEYYTWDEYYGVGAPPIVISTVPEVVSALGVSGYVTQFAVVPEPSTLALTGVATLVGMAWAWRQCRRRS